MKKISIVTPCYNSIKFIQDCVESVKYACEGLDYEHIIVDGASTDGTLEYLEKQEGLVLISERDRGMYEALNKGVRRATGEYIGHLNTDEQYNKEGFRVALKKAQDDSLDAVFGPTVMLNGRKEFLQVYKQVVVPRVIDTYWSMPVQSCSLLYKKNIWERAPYDEQYRIVADHAWFRAQMEMGLKIDVSEGPIGIFVWHPSNISNTLGRSEPEDALPDIDRSRIDIRLAKYWYRLKKLLLGGYSRRSIRYNLFNSGEQQSIVIDRPRLKVAVQELS